MTTATANFDSLQVYERLVKAKLPESAAKEISDILKERAEFAASELATKVDLESSIEKLKLELTATINQKNLELKAELIKWLVGILFLQGSFIVAAIKLL